MEYIPYVVRIMIKQFWHDRWKLLTKEYDWDYEYLFGEGLDFPAMPWDQFGQVHNVMMKTISDSIFA